MRLAVLLAAFTAETLASFCGQASVPFTFQVLRAGYPVLGCARPRCFGWTANGTRVADSAQFYRINGKEDGYLRRSDVLLRQPYKAEGFVPQLSTCESNYRQNGCDAGQWVGGLAPQSEPYTQSLQSRCCSYGQLFNSEDRGIAMLHPGQMVVGGEVTSNGRLIAFDYIANLNKIVADNGTIIYNVHVRRMACFDDEGNGSETIVSNNAIIRETQRGLEKNPLDVAPSDISLQSIQDQPAAQNRALAAPTMRFAQPPGFQARFVQQNQQNQQNQQSVPMAAQPQLQFPQQFGQQQQQIQPSQYPQQQATQQIQQPQQPQNQQFVPLQSNVLPNSFAQQQYVPQPMQQQQQQVAQGQMQMGQQQPQPLPQLPQQQLPQQAQPNQQPQQLGIQQVQQQTVNQQNQLFPTVTLFPQQPQQPLVNGVAAMPTLPPLQLPRLEDIPKIDIPSIEDVEQSIPPVQRAILTSVARFFGVL